MKLPSMSFLPPISSNMFPRSEELKMAAALGLPQPVGTADEIPEASVQLKRSYQRGQHDDQREPWCALSWKVLPMALLESGASSHRAIPSPRQRRCRHSRSACMPTSLSNLEPVLTGRSRELQGRQRRQGQAPRSRGWPGPGLCRRSSCPSPHHTCTCRPAYNHSAARACARLMTVGCHRVPAPSPRASTSAPMAQRRSSGSLQDLPDTRLCPTMQRSSKLGRTARSASSVPCTAGSDTRGRRPQRQHDRSRCNHSRRRCALRAPSALASACARSERARASSAAA
jgi:hypothetical protein